VRALFLQPLPFARASELVVGWAQDRRGAKPVVQLSYPAVRQMARDNPAVAGLAGFPHAAMGGSVRHGTVVVPVRAVPVTGGLFEVLGASAPTPSPTCSSS